MRVSKQKAGEHRDAILAAASRLFRARGIDQVGVAEVTRAAGLTHGGFYGHFVSKEALAAEACGHSFAAAVAKLAAAPDLAAYIADYATPAHRDREAACPMVALGGEVARTPGVVADRFTEGVTAYVAAVRAHLPADDATADGRAAALVSLLVGGLSLARATALHAPALSDALLDGVRRQALDLIASPTPDGQAG